jgi:hypothetical protein
MSDSSFPDLLLANPLPPQLLRLNQPFNLEVPSYTFIDPSQSLTISASLSDGSPLPSWLSFDPGLRRLSGTPPLPGQLNVRFTATTSNGKTVSDTVALSITSGEAALLFNNSYGYGHSISVVGNRAYLATGHTGLAIYNLNQPNQPILLGTYDSPGYARDVGVSGNYAYLADSQSGLVVIDVSSPSNPTLVGTFTWPGYIQANALSISGDFVYVAAWGEGVKIFNISTPGQPVLVGGVDTPGTAINLAVSGNYAYVADDWQGITIINIGDPSAPSLAGSYRCNAYAITISGSQAFVVGSTGLEILSLANPLAPTRLSFYSFPNPEDTYWIQEPTIIGNKLYMSTRKSGVHVLDISDPTAPQLLAVYPTDQSTDLAIADGYIFVADQYNLRVIDRVNTDATPAKAEPLLGVQLNGKTAYQNQPFLYKIPDQSFVDPGDTLSLSASLSDGSPLPVWLSFNSVTRTLSGTPTASENLTITIKAIDQSGLEVSDSFLLSVLAGELNDYATGDLLINGTNAFYANGGSLSVADISDPLQMTPAGSLYLEGYAEEMILRGNTLYIAKPYIGLQIVDVSQPDQPVLKGTFSDSSYVTSVASWGSYILLGSIPAEGKISIIDVSDPASPSLVNSFQVDGGPYSIQTKGNLALISYRNFEGLDIYSLDSLPSPALLKRIYYGNIGTVNDFEIKGDFVYLAGSSGFLVLNISDPSNPSTVGSTVLPTSWQRSLQIVNNIAYVTGPFFGSVQGSDVQAIDITDPSNPKLVASYEVEGSNYGVAVAGTHILIGGTNGLSSIPLLSAVNEAPTAVSLTSVTTSLSENTSTTSRIKVADIAISDDALGTNTISLLGADAAAFEVEGTVLYLKAGTSLDYETKAGYAVTVSVSDAALSGSTPVSTGYSLSITDVNEAPTAQSLLLANPLPPQLLRLNQPFNLEVPSYTFIDPSQSLTISASLSDGSPLPSWLSFDPGLRRLSGTPPLPGQLNVRFTATTSNGKTVSDTVALSITSGEAALLFNNSYGYGHSISVVGNRAYLATGHTGLAIYNLNQPNQPILLGTYDSPGYARDVGVSGNYAYLADSQSGLVVIDVSSPSNPTLVGTFTWPGYIQANALSISGDFVYVAAWGEGVKIFNISTPGQPVLVGGVDTPGTAINLAVSGNYAYVADDWQGITIINIGDPSAPSLAGSYRCNAYAITISGSQAFVVGSTGLEILSLANPLAPTRLSFYSFPNPEDTYWIQEPTIIGNKLYMSTRKSGVHVLDISDPTAPQLLAVYPTDQSTDLAIADGYIFVADQYNLRVIDRVNTDATPAKAEPLLGVQLNGKTAYQNQPFLYKIPDQSFVDPGDTLSLSASLSDGSPLPVWLSFNSVTRTLSGTPTASENLTITIKAIDQSGLEVSDSFLLSVLAGELNDYATGDLLINGTNAFYANGGSLSVADISDPLQMTPAGSLYLEGYAEEMILRGNTLYIAKPYIGLQIVDVSQPDQPVLKGTFSDSSYVTSVASWGSYILLGSIPAEGKISIIDVSDPASPSLVNSFQVDGGPYSIQTKGNLALISYRNFEGLDIYSLDSLPSPALLKRIYYGNIGTVNDFEIKGDFVYLAGSSGFLVLNISDPSNPSTVGSTVLPTSWQRSLQIVNNIAYVTGPFFGSVQGSDVQAIDITDPSNPKLVASYEVEGSNYGVAVAGTHILIGGTNGLSSIPLLSAVNEAPTAVSLTSVTTSLSENTSTTSRIKVADIAISDDALGTNTISLLGADAAAFEVEGTVLYLKAGTSLDYETKAGYAVTVSVSDAALSGSTPVSTGYSLSITDVNEAPTAVALTNVTTSLAENTNTTSRIKVSDIAISDDALGTNTISLLGADAAAFEVDGTTLYLKAGTSLNYETKTAYAVTVSVLDSTIGGSSAASTGYSLAVTDVNEAPTAVVLTNTTASLPENTSTSSRIKVADIAISDDALGTNTISLLGADAAAFEVDGTTLYLKAGTSLNYETKTAYAVTVSVLDSTIGGSSPVSTGYSLSITDVNEAPTAVELTNVTASLAENSSTTSRIKVADIAISDDALGTNSISLSGADAAAFEVEGTVLYLKASTSLNYETKTAYAVTVSVLDSTIGGSSPVSTGYSLSITDVNEAPTAVALTNVTASLAENSSTTSRIKVADIAISDDALGTNSISLSGTDAAAFEVEGTVLYLKASTSLNYETKTPYAVTVSVLDSTIGGSIALSTGYSLAVTDVNEAPTALSLSATAFNENIPAGSLVASLSSSDPDTSPQSFSYALVGGAGDTDNLAFFLIGNQLHITRTPDYEVKSTYGIRLKVTDQGGLSFERHVQLAVNDLPDSPSYSFSSSAPIVYEGGALALGISSSNVAPGTQIYWSFSGTGISSADLGDGSLSGTSTLGGDGGAGFTKTIAADGVVEGVEGLEVKFFSDSARTQQLGSTIQVSIKEPSVGVVTNGPDLITGTAEAETIRGVPMGSTLRGLGTVDKLTGGGGNDDFVLADTSGVFYDDGNATVSETKDMAWITDFSVGDKITLFGSAANYRLSSAFYSSFRGVLINALLPAATPEPIGFVQSATLASLNLANADQFIYLTAP